VNGKYTQSFKIKPCEHYAKNLNLKRQPESVLSLCCVSLYQENLLRGYNRLSGPPEKSLQGCMELSGLPETLLQGCDKLSGVPEKSLQGCDSFSGKK